MTKMVSLRDKVQNMQDGKEDLPPIMKTLGMNMVQFGDGKSLLTIHVDKRFHNPMGTLHGGIMTDLADASMGVALMSTLGDGESFTTLELKMNFLRPVYEGELTAESKVLHRGRTIALVESILKNSEGKEVARATATQMVLRPG
ncbi:MAG: PaaI family thioesterase [Thaumarchaeota archaeon]|nr:PaaI family thioesterase [Nitrososphaerota archaeon]